MPLHQILPEADGDDGRKLQLDLTHLAIGDVAEIEIELDVTGCPGPELTNRAFVCAGEGDEEISRRQLQLPGDRLAIGLPTRSRERRPRA